MALQNIGPVANFPVNKGVCIEIEGKKIAVFNTTGQYYGIDDTCPHRGASFSEGSLNGTVVNCPWHGAEADVRTGMCGPPSPGPVEVYDVSCDSENLFIDLG
ncbi:MAG: Rieske (2Fe-2S) protein [Planctomycetota bacterium]|jgi:nitrite reductase/ring-hydroxylating ferredoxin subunit